MDHIIPTWHFPWQFRCHLLLLNMVTIFFLAIHCNIFFHLGGWGLIVLLRGKHLQSFLKETRQFRRPSIGFVARKHSTNFRHVVDSLKFDVFACVCLFNFSYEKWSIKRLSNFQILILVMFMISNQIKWLRIWCPLWCCWVKRAGSEKQCRRWGRRPARVWSRWWRESVSPIIGRREDTFNVEMIATSHDLGPQKVAKEGKSPYFVGELL